MQGGVLQELQCAPHGPGMGCFSDLGAELLDEPRLADARLADDQHKLTFACASAFPTARQQTQFLLAADERGQRPRGCPPAAATRPHNEEQIDGFGYAIQLTRAPFLRDEEAWDLAQNVCGDEHRPRLGGGLDT